MEALPPAKASGPHRNGAGLYRWIENMLTIQRGPYQSVNNSSSALYNKALRRYYEIISSQHSPLRVPAFSEGWGPEYANNHCGSCEMRRYRHTSVESWLEISPVLGGGNPSQCLSLAYGTRSFNSLSTQNFHNDTING